MHRSRGLPLSNLLENISQLRQQLAGVVIDGCALAQAVVQRALDAILHLTGAASVLEFLESTSIELRQRRVVTAILPIIDSAFPKLDPPAKQQAMESPRDSSEGSCRTVDKKIHLSREASISRRRS